MWLAAHSQPPAEQQAIVQYTQLAAEQSKKNDEFKAQAEQAQKNYDAANFLNDQFDLADVLLAIAISLLVITALTHLWWLYFVALVLTGFGVLLSLSGLVGWGIHTYGLMDYCRKHRSSGNTFYLLKQILKRQVLYSKQHHFAGTAAGAGWT